MSNSEIVPTHDKFTVALDLLERMKPAMRAALPRHLSPDRMVRLVTTTLRRTPQLVSCSPVSLAGAVVQACQLGLEVDGILGEFYLTPRRIHGEWQVVGIPGYRGLLKLARQSGEVDWVQPQAVYAGDKFSYRLGSNPQLEHEPADVDHDPKNIVRTYAVARLRSGSVLFLVMTRSEIDAVRDRYAAARDEGPWLTHYLEMALKTPTRRLCKWLPQSPLLGRAVALDELAEAGLPQGLDALIDPAMLGGKAPSPLDELTRTMRENKQESPSTLPSSSTSPSPLPPSLSSTSLSASTSSSSPSTAPPTTGEGAASSIGETANHTPTPRSPMPGPSGPASARRPPGRPKKFPRIVEPSVAAIPAPILADPDTITSSNVMAQIMAATTRFDLAALRERIVTSPAWAGWPDKSRSLIDMTIDHRRKQLITNGDTERKLVESLRARINEAQTNEDLDFLFLEASAKPELINKAKDEVFECIEARRLILMTPSASSENDPA
jgi:recombination protein RecT